MLITTSIQAMKDEVFMQEILHNSNRQSFELVFHKDVDSVQKNIRKLYNICV